MLSETFLNEGWQFAEATWPSKKIGYIHQQWLPANVPGHVHLDLMEAGIIPDPHVRMNEVGVQWVDEKDWTYRCKFEWSRESNLPNQALRFDGLDTVCTIHLNGQEIGQHDNMFTPKEIDVTGKLNEGENDLEVRFFAAKRVGAERRQAYFAQEGIDYDPERFDERAFVRKIQCMFGWDWGPSLVSAGIWKPVRLIEYARRITDVQTYQTWHDDGSVTLSAKVQTEGDGELSIVLWPRSGSSEPIEFDGDSVTIQNPVLWWPHNLREGKNPLFDLVVRLFADNDSDEPDDVCQVPVGFSHIRLLREKDQIGESFEFEVNGEKVYAVGANWIPDTSFPSAISRPQLEERLRQAVDIGCNMLRVWGGGTYESNDFYDLCDELGIMVWQDFPFACGYYPDGDADQAVIAQEARENILRIRNHPSLALWCGNNENLQMWQQKWGGAAVRHPHRYYGVNHYEGVLPKVVAEFDPGRSYIPTSPVGDSEPDCNGGKIGDSHYWDVWHGRGDWKYYLDSDTRFSSEYGFSASCSLALWEETLAEADWDYASPAVKWHDKTGKGFDTYVGYVELHYPKSESLEDFTYYSQLNQRDAIKLGVEHFRRNGLCRGSLIWQLNDIWPVQSWALIDSSGRYKAASYELRRLYSNFVFSLAKKNERVQVFAANDDLHPVATDIVVRAIHLHSGETLKRWEFEADLESGERTVIGELDVTGLNIRETVLIAEDDEHRSFQLLCEPKEASFAAPKRILLSNSPSDPDDVLSVDITIEGPVVDLMLSVDGDTDPFVDNFVTFPEAGVYELRVKQPIDAFEARSLAGDHVTAVTRSPIVGNLLRRPR